MVFKYKRLTKRNVGETFRASHFTIYHRLHALENAIEDGWFVKIPFQTGDKIYLLESDGKITKARVSLVSIEDGEIFIDYEYRDECATIGGSFPECAIGEYAFKTRKAAEKYKKENRNGKKSN